MKYDVVVVGNGPSGSFSAMHSAAEKDTAVVGAGIRRVQCAGLISRSGLEKIGVSGGDFVLNTVRGAKLFSPGGVEAIIDAKRPMASVVDRIGFDAHLLNRAVSAGAEYIEDWALSLDNGVRLKSGATLAAERIILASGTDYSLQMRHGIPRPREFLVGGQYEMKLECDPDFVELHFLLPDFFAWVIPLKDRARVGLCVKGNPRPHLDAFVKRLKRDGRVKSDTVLSESFGIIPVHEPAMKTVHGSIVTVGDAAGQVKATTGGGIIFGCLAAAHAYKPDYETLWRRELSFDLRVHLMMHRLVNRLSDSGKDRLIRILADCHGLLEAGGDMDYASTTATAMLKSPRFLAEAAMNMPWLAADALFRRI